MESTPPRSLTFFKSIQGRLVGLILVIMLPMAALWAWYVRVEVAQAQVDAYAQVNLAVDNVASNIALTLEGYEKLLAMMAKEYEGSPPRQAARFNPAQFLRLHDAVLTVGVRDLSAQNIYASTPAPLSPAAVAATDWGARGMHEDRPTINGAFFGPNLKRWVTVLTHPVHDAQGRHTGFVYMALDLEKFNQHVLNAMPAKIIVPVIDQNNRILMRSLDPQQWIGKSLPQGIAQTIQGMQQGNFVSVDLQGVQRFYALKTLPESGWRIAAGVTQAEALSAAQNRVGTAIALGLLTLLSMLAMAWWRASTIAKPIQALATSVHRIRQEPNHRTFAEGPVELQQVAQQINSLLDQIDKQQQERLALSSHYASIIANARDIIFLFDSEGFVVEANGAALNAYGYTLDELRKLRVHDLRAPEGKPSTEQDWGAADQANGTLFETVHQRKDGTVLQVEVSSNVIQIDGKTYRQSFIRDITQRKLVEASLERKSRALSALSACNAALIHAQDLPGLLDSVCSIIVNDGGYRMAWVGQKEHNEAKSIRPVAHRGMDEGYLAQLRVSWADDPFGRGPTGRAVREGVTIVAHNLKTAPNFEPWREAATAHGFAASIGLPLLANGENLGVLTVYAADTRAFDATEVGLLEELARNLAYGIEHLNAAAHSEQLNTKLGASESRFQMLIEQSPSGIYIIRDGVFVYANPRMEEIVGYDNGELVGKRLEDLILPEDWHILTDAEQRLNLVGSTGHLSVRGSRKDGTAIELGLQDVQADYEGSPAVIGMAQDISENNRAQAEIQQYIARLESTTESTLQAVSLMVEQRDPYTAGHERRVGELAGAIGREMGLTEHQVKGLRLTGFVHDIGKIAVPAELLAKPTRLTDAEMSLIRVHPQAGYEVLKDVEFPWPVAEVIRQHHERIDGSGYPRGLKGTEILLEARIMMVADVVESMSSHRPYRASRGLDAALEEITQFSGSHYDPDVVDACKRLFLEKSYSIPNEIKT